MEYWAESQGQPPPYAKFGTVPGRNYIHVVPNKHQAAGFQSYHCERQDRSREPSCWTIPGSRSGGVLQDYNNWIDMDPSPTTSHFPFSLNSQLRQHQSTREYQAHEKRDREWVAENARAARDRERERGCEREMQKVGWQRRWESCSPVRYRREVAKRSLSDSSYRELEAWAARYSHSLPRRRRMEVEMWGAAQGSPESERVPERGNRSANEPRASTLHLSGFSGQTRELGKWERRATLQSPIHHISQPLVPETTPMSDSKKNDPRHHRRVFSEPPGYILPPPYNAPHNISPVLQRAELDNTEETMASVNPSWERGLPRPTYPSQPSLKKQEFSGERGGQVEEFVTDPAWLRHQGQAWPDLPPAQNTPVESDPCPSSLKQQPPQQSTKAPLVEGPTEGRKLSLKKRRRGGETIFCLVSRMEDTSEISRSTAQPLSISCSNPSSLVSVPSTEVPEGCRSPGEISNRKESQKLADEVDSGTSSLQLDSDVPPQPLSIYREGNLKMSGLDWMNSKHAAAHKEELLRVIKHRTKNFEGDTERQSLSNETDHDIALPENTYFNNSSSPMSGRRAVQPLASASVKYPLWREPSDMGQFKSDSSSPCSLEGSWKCDEPEKDLVNDQKQTSPDVGNPIDIEVKRLEIKKDKDSDNSSGILVIDTTHVIVRVEFIFPPKKEHVQYLCSSSHSGPPPGLNSVLPSETMQPDTQIQKFEMSEQSTDMLNKLCSLPDNVGPQTDTEQVEVQDYVSEDQPSPEVLVKETGLTEKTGEAGQVFDPVLSSPLTTEENTLNEQAESFLRILQQDSSTQSLNENAISSLSYTEDQTEKDASLTDDCENKERNNECLSEVFVGKQVKKVASLDYDKVEVDVCITDVTQDDGSYLCDQISTENEEDSIEQRNQIHIKTAEENPINVIPIVEVKTAVTNEPFTKPSPLPSHDESQLDFDTTTLPDILCVNTSPVYFDSPPQSPNDSPCHSQPLSPITPSNSPQSSTDPLFCLQPPSTSPLDSSPDSEPFFTELSESTPLRHFPSSSSSPTLSVPLSPSSSSLPLGISRPQCSDTLFPSTTGIEEPQYPKSLWDAVNRIRKHTAPDSESEEEEVAEPWDPESMGDDSSCLESDMDLSKKKHFFPVGLKELMVFNSSTKKNTFEEACSEGFREEDEEGIFLRASNEQGEQDEKYNEDSCDSRTDDTLDDTLSCSSTDSHCSEDTVIRGNEENPEANSSDSETEKETEDETETNKKGENNCQEISVTEVEGGSSSGMSTSKILVEGVPENRNIANVRDTSEPCQMEDDLTEIQHEDGETGEKQETGEVKCHIVKD